MKFKKKPSTSTAIMHICGSAWARLMPLFQPKGRAITEEATPSGVICGKFNRFGWLSLGKLDFKSSLLEPFGNLCKGEYRIRHVVAAGLISKCLRLFQFRFWQEPLIVDTNGNTNKKRPGKVRCLLNFKLVFCTCTIKWHHLRVVVTTTHV